MMLESTSNPSVTGSVQVAVGFARSCGSAYVPPNASRFQNSEPEIQTLNTKP